MKQGLHTRMIVLYGDLHVGTRHLPYQLSKISKRTLKKSVSWITIHQNQDQLFWKLAAQKRELHTEIVKLKKNVYCVLSSTPWAKLQSLISWAEGETSDSSETEQDYLSILGDYGRAVSKFLYTSAPSYESVSICSMDQCGFLDKLKKNKSIRPDELRLIRMLIANNQRFYISQVNFAYLASPSHNGAAELATIHLLRTKMQLEHFFKYEVGDFYRLVLEFGFGFFGSLIFNPRRKCDFPIDHLRRIKALKTGKPEAFKLEMEARQIAVGLLRNKPYPGLDIKTIMNHKRLAPAAFMGAKYVGQIIGKRLHQSVIMETVEIKTIRELFFREGSKKFISFEDRYHLLKEAIALATLPLSKDHHL
jgi:hypothetical protein